MTMMAAEAPVEIEKEASELVNVESLAAIARPTDGIHL